MGGQTHAARTASGVFDWTLSPAKWGAVGVLAAVGVVGLAFSLPQGGDPAGTARASARGRPPLAWVGEGDLGPGLAVEDVARPTSESVPGVGATSELEPGSGSDGIDPIVIDSGRHPSVPALRAPPSGGLAQTIDVNSATEAELQLLPGIGPARARAIIEDRRANGPFRSVADLERVRGIGPAIVEGLRNVARAH